MKNFFLIALTLAMTGCAQMSANNQSMYQQQPQYMTQQIPTNCLGDKLNITFIKNHPYSNGRMMNVEDFYDNPSWMVAYLQRHPENENLMKSWLLSEVKKGSNHGTKAYSVLGVSGMIYDNKQYSTEFFLHARQMYANGVQNYCETGNNSVNYNPYLQSSNMMNQAQYNQQQYAQQQALLVAQQRALQQQQYYNQQPYYYQQPMQKPSLMQSIIQSLRH